MALVLRVGTAADLFTEPFAGQLVRVLEHHFGKSMHLGGSSENDGWASIELGYSWLKRLQDHARSVLDPKRIPHLLFMSSWRGAFVPVETITGELSEIAEPDEPFAIASLVSLHDELRVLSRATVPPSRWTPEETGETGEYDKWGGENAYLGEHEISTISLFILGLGVLRVGARKIDGTRGAG